MKSNRKKSLIAGLFAVVVLLAGVGLTTANAQGKQQVIRRPSRVIVVRPYNPFWHRYYDPFWDPFYASRRVVVDPIAYQRERGFSEGLDEGEEDAKKGRPANATGHKDYLKSKSITFREAFVKGYDEGYREELSEIKEKASEKRGD